jgi:hypothetical protein
MTITLFVSGKPVPPQDYRLVNSAIREALQEINARYSDLEQAITHMDWAHWKEAHHIENAISNGFLTPDLYQQMKDFVTDLLQPDPVCWPMAA